MKYHPKYAAERQRELQKAMRKRLAVFLELMNSGRAENVSLDINNAEAVVKLLDASKSIYFTSDSDEQYTVDGRPAISDHFPGGQDCVWLRLLEIPFLEFNSILGIQISVGKGRGGMGK